ncbi:hypothetical protein [Klebsiella aerogenes]|uniref:hypothetical protein n=1 Tax=Klebsiella aerogenes TaxID=548 RepID=UPI001C2315C0|nr:hypothetical protein [Klebsiella aerogenes]QXA73960.1 hypothetical protein I6L71_23560 [Klebsiella aerogenes]
MSYGVTLTAPSGEVWVTPDSIPLALYSKQTITLRGGTNEDEFRSVTYDSSQPMIAFVCFTNGYAKANTTYSGNECRVVFSFGTQQATAEIYFFTVFEQEAPNYGLAIWDASGRLILTDKTRTLSDIQSYGQGYDTNVTNSGKWAVSPLALGLVVGVVSDPLPRPFQGEYHAYAIYNGSSTNIRAMVTQTPSGNISGVTYINMRNSVLAIDCSRYD